MDRTRATLFALVALTMTVFPVSAEDWPEWRGAGRRGVWSEQGILETFPADGLRYTWRAEIGEGYSGPAVAAGRVFVTDFVREQGLRGVERAVCLDERSGKRLWSHEWPVDYTGTQPKWANGPRATPTVDGERVYVVGGMGRLFCLEVATGRVLWQRGLCRRLRRDRAGLGRGQRARRSRSAADRPRRRRTDRPGRRLRQG